MCFVSFCQFLVVWMLYFLYVLWIVFVFLYFFSLNWFILSHCFAGVSAEYPELEHETWWRGERFAALREIKFLLLAIGVSHKKKLVQIQSITNFFSICFFDMWQVICIAELRLGLLAQSCLAPGFSTLMANYFTTRSTDGEKKVFYFLSTLWPNIVSLMINGAFNGG